MPVRRNPVRIVGNFVSHQPNEAQPREHIPLGSKP